MRRGITVLTKSDAVDAETLEVVRLEVEEFLRGTFLDQPKSPIDHRREFALTGAGLDDLKQAMVAAAADVQPRDSPCDRSLAHRSCVHHEGFRHRGDRNVGGRDIRREDELEVFPPDGAYACAACRFMASGGAAVAGQRTALNLAGASTEDLSRGMTLAPPETFETTRRADVSLRLLSSAARR